MKKASEWFDMLEPHVASRAKIYITAHEKQNKEYLSLQEALRYAFSWSETLEGWSFWNRIANR